MQRNNKVPSLGRVRPPLSLAPILMARQVNLGVPVLDTSGMPSISVALHNGDVALPSVGTDFYAPRLSSFSQITEYLYVGDVSAGRTAHEHGVTHVINCMAGQSDGRYPKQPGVHYLDIAMLDNTGYDISQDFTRAISFISSARSEGGRVLVHCYAGISRSATIALAYLMSEEPRFNYSFESAFSYVASKRHQISPNLGFIIALGDFEKKLQDNAQSRSVEASEAAAAAAAEHHQTSPLSPELKVIRASTQSCDSCVEGSVEEVTDGLGTCPTLSLSLPLYCNAVKQQHTLMFTPVESSESCPIARRATT